MKTKIIMIGVGVIILLSALGYGIWAYQQQPGQLDAFAKCIKDKGAIFYGAFWCPHCQDQKKEFGKSEKYLPYVECSTPDSNGQLQVCKDQQIAGYPTWKFADGSVLEGEVSLSDLAQKTGCQINNAQ